MCTVLHPDLLDGQCVVIPVRAVSHQITAVFTHPQDFLCIVTWYVGMVPAETAPIGNLWNSSRIRTQQENWPTWLNNKHHKAFVTLALWLALVTMALRMALVILVALWMALLILALWVTCHTSIVTAICHTSNGSDTHHTIALWLPFVILAMWMALFILVH